MIFAHGTTMTEAEYAYSQKTPHTSPLWVSYGVSFVRIWGENWLRYNTTSR